jgi:branched-chain amino acid aminotransferase
MSDVVFLGGRFVDARRARVSALDRGFLYGDGLFETVRVYHGRAFALAEHLDRLRRTARRVGFAIPGARSRWDEKIRALVRRNRLADADVAVRITVTRGVGGEGLLPPKRPRPTILLTVRRLDPKLARLRKRGVLVTILPFHPGVDGFLAGEKTVDYLTAIVGKRLARSRRAFEGIYSTPDGAILEGTTSNVFAVVEGTLVTPPIGGGVLPGVTRGIIGRSAADAGIPFAERPLHRAEFMGASEAFLTATTIEVMPIRAIDGRVIAGTPGPRTTRLQHAFVSELRKFLRT